MKQSIQIKLGQSLTMTPQLQQAIRLLQLSTLDLQQEIQNALDSNPMLEVDEQDDGNHIETNPADNCHDSICDSITEHSQAKQQTDTASEIETTPLNDSQWDNSIPEDLPTDSHWDDIYQPNSAAVSTANQDFDFSDPNSNQTQIESLQEHLLWQLNLSPMSDRDRLIAVNLIDAIEPNGMLGTAATEIFESLSDNIEELEYDEVEAVLHRIQLFDPIGVAAHDLSECLLIQLNQLPKETQFLEAAKLIVREHLGLMGNRDYRQLMRRTKLKEGELKEAIELIQGLNPLPGEQIYTTPTEYITPDVYVRKRQGRWQVDLNSDIAPNIRINEGYASLVKRADNSDSNVFLRDHLQEARWFLKSLMSRNDTLLKVASCIVDKQQEFFERGEEGMRPLVLNEIAEIVDMHESTISRVTTNKYMHTPAGIFELKYFFSSHVSTDSGGELSSTAIRAMIKKLVANEPARKPLSDNKITTLLADQGIKVARRTIAKYRESMGIPPSNERKELV